MIAAYLRVSSSSQDLATQRSAIERAARARGDRIGRWFHEKQSGRSLERRELARVREAARRGELTALYVFRLDRLTRSGIRDTLGVVEELRGAGCKLVTVADGFELGGPAADIVIAVMAWAAQMERTALGERIRAARARVEAAGGRWGRPPRATPAQVRKVLELRRQRVITRSGARFCSIREIAQRVKLPRSTVSDIVSEKGAYAAAARAAGKQPRPQRDPPASG